MKLRAACFVVLLNSVTGLNIAEQLINEGATELVNLVQAAGLVDALTNEDSTFTVFAPSNHAIKKLPKSLVNQLTSDTELLKKVLLYHVIEGAVKSSDIVNDITVPTLEGGEIRANVYCKNREKYHPGGLVTINGKQVIRPDIIASNGVVHIIADVLYPLPSGNIAEVVSGDERFSTLLAAVQAAGLAGTLSGDGPFTVFAPTNEAFAKIPEETLNGLLADKAALTEVLLRHVVPGTVFYKGLCPVPGDRQSAGGDNIKAWTYYKWWKKIVKIVSDSGKGRVIVPDIIATNGVIHAIDMVI